MPPRPQYTVPRFSVGELPILPFLAPRAFASWPPALGPRRPYCAVPSNQRQTPEKIHQHVLNSSQNQSKFPSSSSSSTSSSSLSTAAGKHIEIHHPAKQWVKRFAKREGPENSKMNSKRLLHFKRVRHTQWYLSASSGETPDAQRPNPRKRRLRILRILTTPESPHRSVFPPFGNTKLVRVPLPSSGPTHCASSWDRRYAFISRRFEKMAVSDLPDLTDLPYTPAIERMAETLLNSNNEEDMRKIWRSADLRRRRQWHSVISWTLQRNPIKTIEILLATCNKYSPTHVIAEALEFIATFNSIEEKAVNPNVNTRILKAVKRMLTNSPSIKLSQRTVFRVLRHLEGPKCADFFEFLHRRNVPLHENTIFHFASHLAKTGETETAMKALEAMSASSILFQTVKMRCVCASILDRKNRAIESETSDSELYHKMIDLGLQPSTQIYNILLKNALIAGNQRIAWTIHDSMEESDVKPDVHTYSHLLNYAKLSGDEDSLQRIVRLTKAKGIINQYIATDFLDTVFRIYKQRLELYVRQVEESIRIKGHRRNLGPGPPTPFRTMLSIYSEYFDMQPLKDLAPDYVELYKNAIRDHDSKIVLMQPENPTLVVMFQGLLQTVKTPTRLSQLYEHLKSLIADGHPAAQSLAQTEQLHIALLMSMGKHDSLLHLCTDVIRHMIDNGRIPESKTADDEFQSQKSSSDSTDTKASSPQIATPTVRTWSILSRIFIDRDQLRAAEKVIKMMRERDVEPDISLWNCLAVGYALQQDVVMVADVVRRVQKQGLEPNDGTFKALNMIRDKEALSAALSEMEKKEIWEALPIPNTDVEDSTEFVVESS